MDNSKRDQNNDGHGQITTPVIGHGLAPRESSVIDEEMAESIIRNLDASRSPATVKAYRSDWQHFRLYCSEKGLPEIPADPHVVAAYISHLAESDFAWATISRRISTISKAHQAKGLPSPTTAVIVQEVTKGIRRRIGTATTKAKALLPVDLARWLPLLGELETPYRNARDASLLTLGLAGGFRRSELANLKRRDIEHHEKGLLITIRSSKTDQEGEGALVGIKHGRHDVTCPVRRWKQWSEMVAEIHDPAGPAFFSIEFPDELTARPIAPKTVARTVKRIAKLGGAEEDLYSGHSLRVGFITAAVAAGAREDRIMAITRHRSHQTLAGYIQTASIWDDNPTGFMGL